MNATSEFVESLIELIHAMLPKRGANSLSPAKVQLLSFSGGSGAAKVGLKQVTVLASPGEYLVRGDTVIVVPLDENTYYVVGKV